MTAELSRREFARLAAAVAAAPPAPPPAAFPFGTHVYREPHLPMEELRSDFGLLRRLGFNMVKIQESWAVDEKKEGQIDLATVARVVSDARQNGLTVYFGVTMEQAPAWLWKKFPDAVMVYENGQPHNDPTQYLMPSDGKPGPCWHHPGARAAAIRFIEAVGRAIGRYDNIRVWNVWQEIGYWPLRAGHNWVCYCPHSLAAYRQWLRGRYPTLEELNRAWRSGFGDWEEVEPPRSYSQVPSMPDWRYFMEDVHIANVLWWKAEAFRRSDPLRRPVMAHAGNPTTGSTAEWRYAEPLDLYGSSAYPSWGELPDPDVSAERRVRESPAVYRQLVEGVVFKFDYVRAVSRGRFWTAELQGGRAPGGVDPGRVPEAGDIRRWTLGSLAAGARGICFWNHRNEPFWGEAGGFGLLERKGDSTDRAAEASRIARAVAAHAELFADGSVPAARAALALDARAWHFANASNVGPRYRGSIRGCFLALWECGIPLDYIETGAIPADAGQYKLLILPFPLLVTGRAIERLGAYVRAGGAVLAEACLGRYDEETFGVAEDIPPALSEVFGCRHEALTVLADKDLGRRMQGAGGFGGHTALACSYLQFLRPEGGRAILTYGGRVCGCESTFGSGKAWLAGTLLGRAFGESNDAATRGFVAALAARAGVPAEMAGKLRLRRRVLGPKSAWFLFNTSREPVEEEVRLPAGSTAADLLGGDLARSGESVKLRVEPMDVRCLILESRS